LAVEVVSRHDSYSEIDRKVRAYLGDGVRLVWVIDPRQQSVTVYAPDGTFTHLGMDDALSGGEVVAEFEMRVAALFED
jgi:Uma2 family endonuclease